MAKYQLILTADYEVFGDGSGCIDKCLIDPAEQMMKIVEDAGGRLMFFVDVCEYWVFEDCEKNGIFPEDYQPATKIRSQLQDSIRRGHDVQLHFHPQWLQYKYNAPGDWDLNMELWRLPKVKDITGTDGRKYSVDELFRYGKETLEQMLQPIDSDYRCHIFRAGSWCIQPEQEVLEAMRKHGFDRDMTVAPGLYAEDGMAYYDFREAPQDMPKWFICNSVNHADPHGAIVEIPIFTINAGPVKKAQFLLQRRKKGIPSKPANCSGKAANAKSSGFIDKLKRHLGSGHLMFDFCGGASFEEMRWIIKQARKRYHTHPAEKIPIVAIGHPKMFGNAGELIKILNWVNDQDDFRLYGQ